MTLDSPRDGDIHTLADFAELLCLITPDRFVSRDYLRDYIQDHTGKKTKDNDLDDAFSQFSWRVAAFGQDYPFSLQQHDKVLSGEDDLNVRQAMYTFLLLCANLPFVQNEKGDRQLLTDAFERIALQALQRLWPNKAVIRAFGKNETIYVGKKWERLNTLGRDLGGEPTLTEETYRKHDSGDGGIDLAAWLDLDDHEKLCIPTALAQCACSRDDWPKKQNEISANRLGNHLKPSHPWMEMIFIPQSFRDNHGKWAIYGDIGRVIVIDRLRILNHVDTEHWEDICAPAIFTKFLEFRLELV